MGFLLDQLRAALPLIVHGDPTLLRVVGFTLEVVGVATGVAVLLGIPLGLALGLGRFRGSGALRTLANASLGLPPALVGVVLFLAFARQAPLGSLQLVFTARAVFIAQSILALPYTVALTAAAVQAVGGDLLAQARLLGAGRRQLALLALREARPGVIAGVLAAMGTGLAEVAAIAIVGGNIPGDDQTLASATLFEVNRGDYAGAIAIAIVLCALILVLMGAAGLLQQRSGIRVRFRTAR
jgi:tungstate transport system permease protein